MQQQGDIPLQGRRLARNAATVHARYLRHNVIELNKKTYFYVGQMISMSLIHCDAIVFSCASYSLY
jgi:hypothetical protein